MYLHTCLLTKKKKRPRMSQALCTAVATSQRRRHPAGREIVGSPSSLYPAAALAIIIAVDLVLQHRDVFPQPLRDRAAHPAGVLDDGQ